jgi:hypothetical protein
MAYYDTKIDSLGALGGGAMIGTFGGGILLAFERSIASVNSNSAPLHDDWMIVPGAAIGMALFCCLLAQMDRFGPKVTIRVISQ